MFIFAILATLCLIVNAEFIYFDYSNQKSFKDEFKGNDIFSSEINFAFSGFDLIKDGEYDVIAVSNWGSMAFEEGMPSLPMMVKRIALPDYGDIEYELVDYKEIEVKGTYNIKPMQAPLPEVIHFVPSFVKDEAVYNTNELYPSERISIEGPSIMRDVRFVKFYFSPFRYNPVTKKLYVISEGTIKIKVNINKTTGDDPNSKVLTEEFLGMYQTFFSNYTAVERYKPIETRIDRNNRLSNTKGANFTGEGDYLIVVAGTALSAKIRDFAIYKSKLGYTPVIMHLSNATTTTSSYIKTMIQNAYTNWTVKPVYVLLVGDADSTLFHVDTSTVLQCQWKRAADFGISYSYGIKAGYIPNDHFYTLLNGTDHYADAYIGRFNVKDTLKLNVIVNKIKNYETSPVMTDPTWFTHYIGLGATEDGRIFDTTAAQFWKNLKAYGWSHWDSLIETASWTPSQTQVLDSMNDGSNIMLFRGHGAEGYDGDSDDGSGYAWFGGADKGYITMCTNEMIAAVNQPTTVSVGFNFAPTCLAGNFAYPRSVRDSSSMGDYWTHLNSKGGVGLFAATNVSLSYYNDSMSLGVSHAIVNRNSVMPKREFGRVSAYSKIYMETYAGVINYFQLEAYMMNILGDPACVIYTKVPKSFIVAHDSKVQTRTDTITITLTDNTKAAVAGATVCLYDTLETTPIHQIALTDAAGKAVFINTYTRTGTLFLTASKQDYIQYMGTVTIEAATPVMEVSLSGDYSDGKVNLAWTATNSELINKFNIYRDETFVKSLDNSVRKYTEIVSDDGRKVYSLETVYTDGHKSLFKLPIEIINAPSIEYSNNSLRVTGINNVVMYNISGQSVYEHNFKGKMTTISMKEFSTGIYFIKTDKGLEKRIQIIK